MHIANGDVRRRVRSSDFALRRKLLLGLMLFGMLALVIRAVDLQIFNKSFLQQQAQRQHVAEVVVPAYRGQIKDRHGEPLAISTPVQSVWANPQQINTEDREKIRQVGRLLSLSGNKLQALISKKSNRRFVYLKRRINPDLAAKIKELGVDGIHFEKEFKRFYPAGEVSGHLVGFTDIDDVGQEGLERAYEASLRGIAGKKHVIKDGKGRIIKDVENIAEPVAGQDLTLTIDQRIQYLAYRELQAAFIKHQAHSASLVVLDAKTGEVLAAVNQPAFNPNTRRGLSGRLYRNRAIVDVFEPGSTVKPFVIAAALDGGYVAPDEIIETHGFHRVGRNLVRDVHNYGDLDLTHVLKKSSNVAASKIALRMPPQHFWSVYRGLGFGSAPGVGFPGEASGALQDYRQWSSFEQATMSFGYGLSTSLLQLARAYTALADDGLVHSVTLLQRDEDYQARRVYSAANAQKVREMLEHVVKKDGTAYQARVAGFRVAGKTGTVKKATAGGYADKRYFAVFVGLAPVSSPRFVIAVMVDEPSAGDYYGGLVAAPVFAKVMAGALRVYGVTPDKEDTMPVLLTRR
ncbi:penicillin-binding protein 2 [Methylomarinum sp. Ch1-1]|uniref:Peptidoglycan D,D-transpeptidase FtsI n=1 Tax=Methylomarinum roseum TaxID=3067653 RepID=A0AAU7NXM4_9GAMM|nr:penicillin-binding protein 2 [Methylomarinum sp. Ch1-1]MDP4522174.1 penicillin-binding protein 2 [Methylomarinum sp. Ch1-1]